MQTLETLLYYVLCTLFLLPCYLDEQCGEFLKLWLDYHGFGELCDLIKSYTTIVNDTQLKDEFTTIGNFTLLKDLN